MADFSGDPTASFTWPPPDWGMGAPLQIGASEYGVLGGTDPTAVTVPPPDVPLAPPVSAPMAMPVSGDAANGYTPLTPFVPEPPKKAAPKSETKAKTVADILGAPSLQQQPWPPPAWSGGASSLQPGLGVPQDALSSAVPAPGLEAPPAIREQPTLPPGEDPWANALGNSVQDKLGGIAEPVQPGTDEAIIRRHAEQLASDPMALATANMKLRDETQNYLANRLTEINDKDRKQREDNERVTVEARTKANAEMQQLQQDSKDLQNGGYGWAKLGTGQKIAAVAAIIAGGLHSSLKQTNGQNIALQIVQKNLDDDLAARQHALQQRRQLLGDRFTNLEAQNRDLEAHRIAGYDQAIRALQAEMMNYQPGGTAATNLANTIAGVQQLKQQSLMTLQDRAYKQAETTAKIQLDYANAEKAKAEAAKAAAKAAGGGGGGTYSRAELERVAGPGAQFLPPADPKNPNKTYSEKEVNQALETAQKALGVRKAAGEPAKEAREVLVHGMLDENGQPYLAPDKETARALRDKKSAAELIVKTLDEVEEIRDQVGGESSISNSDEFQRLKLLEPRLALLSHKGTQGMSSDADMENLRAAVGAKDLTTFRSLAATLKEARERTVETFNTEAVNLGAKPIDFPRTRTPHTDTDGEKKYKEGIKRDQREYPKGDSGFHRDPKTGQVMFE